MPLTYTIKIAAIKETKEFDIRLTDEEFELVEELFLVSQDYAQDGWSPIMTIELKEPANSGHNTEEK